LHTFYNQAIMDILQGNIMELLLLKTIITFIRGQMGCLLLQRPLQWSLAMEMQTQR